MGEPSVSQRLHYRSVPGEASEPTSTIVLTFHDNHFVDIRVFKAALHAHHGQAPLDASALDWAFAGRSKTTPGPSEGQSHTVWEHWIDSRSEDPDPDEGDMTTLPDGTVLEQGSTFDKESGAESPYEELWLDLPIRSAIPGQDPECLLLRTTLHDKACDGILIQLGRYVQCLLKTESEFTVERWEAVPSAPKDDAAGTSPRSSAEPLAWSRCFKVGHTELPCERVCKHDELPAKFVIAEIEWEVIEKHDW